MVRVAGALQSELARLLARERDLEELLVTITHVTVSPDLRQARVMVSSLAKNSSPAHIIDRLQSHAKQWQGEIARRLPIKYTPRLEFSFDTAMERGDRVLGILHEVEEEGLDTDPHP
jgi:ribosome-binding factor A